MYIFLYVHRNFVKYVLHMQSDIYKIILFETVAINTNFTMCILFLHLFIITVFLTMYYFI